MKRFTVTIKVSFFAFDLGDAEHLARMLVDRLNRLMGQEQATAEVTLVVEQRP